MTSFQKEMIAFFVHAFSAVSLPKSVGEIYGLLFSTEEPLSLDDIIERLKISRGSAFQGIAWLRDLGAAKAVYLAGVRKDHFTAETELRKLAAGFLRDQIEPHVESGAERLRVVESVLSSNGSSRVFEQARLSKIQQWHKFLRRALPVVKALASKF